MVIYIKDGVGVHNRTFITIHLLESYYLKQAGRGLSPTPGVGLVYLATLYLQQGHWICKFLAFSFAVPNHRVERG